MGSKERFYMDIQTLNSGVTGSCHLCIVKYPDGTTTRFIVDCGLFQGKYEPEGKEKTEKELEEEQKDNDEEERDKKTKNYNRDFTLSEESIEFVLLTHNHVDHTGRLPLLCKNGFTGKIYMTNPTTHLLPLALFDSHKVLKNKAKMNHEPELYGEHDVEKVLSQSVGVPYNEAIKVDENICVTFFQNGHLPGAALILVKISCYGCDDINFLFTGDYNNKNIFFDVPPLPKEVLELPISIMQESTYGDMDSSDIEPCFVQNLLGAVSKKMTVVIPVFSLGRSQEILYLLRCLQQEEKLDFNVPIYFDGKLAIRYTTLYRNAKYLCIKEEMTDFLPYHLETVDSSIRDLVILDENPKIIVTTSGMGSYGPAQTYIPAFIDQANALIHFTGYVAEGTLGRNLKDANIGESVEISGRKKIKRAQVEYTSEFSAHAKADEMIAFLQQFQHLNLVLVNHGEPEVKDKFADRILQEVNTKDVAIAGRNYFFRVTPYRLQKTISTKFL